MEDPDVLLVFKVPTGNLSRPMAQKYMMNFAERMKHDFGKIEGVKLLFLTSKEDWDVYAIPLKAMIEGNIQGDSEAIANIVNTCKKLLKEYESEKNEDGSSG